MYQYTDFDRQFVHARAAQFRDQLDRHFAGHLDGDDFKALRLQNGWYIQRHAPMLRVAVPYGAISSAQVRALADIARVHDRGYTHFTTRQNVQYNWIPLTQAADVMDKLAAVDMHGIQTSGNCIRNITTDALAGVAADELIDPRPYCEILRQWSTLHPEFAFLPRKFKIAVTGALEDRAAIGWHDVGLRLKKNEAGEIGFEVLVGGGMGRTPIVGSVISTFVPWQQILVYLEAIVRVYNRFGRRDNAYKARIKILVKAEGQKFFDAVNAEFAAILSHDTDGDAQLIPQAEFDRVAASFTRPAAVTPLPEVGLPADLPLAYQRWIQRNVHAHQVPGWRAVTLSVKRAGQAPGDVTDVQMDQAADLADRFSQGELRVTHDQNLLLPWVKASDLPEVYAAAKAAGYATPNIGLVTDMIACPGGDFCDLANARSIPGGRRADRTVRRPGRGVRPGRHRPAHQRLHQLLRPPPHRPHRHPRRGQGRLRVVPGHARRLGRLEPRHHRRARQGDRPVVRRQRDHRRGGSDPGNLPQRARGRREVHRRAAPPRPRPVQGRRQRPAHRHRAPRLT